MLKIYMHLSRTIPNLHIIFSGLLTIISVDIFKFFFCNSNNLFAGLVAFYVHKTVTELKLILKYSLLKIHNIALFIELVGVNFSTVNSLGAHHYLPD